LCGAAESAPQGNVGGGGSCGVGSEGTGGSGGGDGSVGGVTGSDGSVCVTDSTVLDTCWTVAASGVGAGVVLAVDGASCDAPASTPVAGAVGVAVAAPCPSTCVGASACRRWGESFVAWARAVGGRV
jgi:hypothetical protein